MIRSCLPNVFDAYFEDPSQAKEFADCVSVVASFCNARKRLGSASGQVSRAQLTEHDVLKAIHQMTQVLDMGHQMKIVGFEKPAKFIRSMFNESKNLVIRAACDTEKTQAVRLGIEDYEAQLLYQMIALFEKHIEENFGTISYKNGDISIGTTSDDTREAVKNLQMPYFRRISKARHWYFNRVGSCPNLRYITDLMNGACDLLSCTHTPKARWEPTWSIPDEQCTHGTVTLHLDRPSEGLSMFVRTRHAKDIVGRNQVVKNVATLLLAELGQDAAAFGVVIGLPDRQKRGIGLLKLDKEAMLLIQGFLIQRSVRGRGGGDLSCMPSLCHPFAPYDHLFTYPFSLLLRA